MPLKIGAQLVNLPDRLTPDKGRLRNCLLHLLWRPLPHRPYLEDLDTFLRSSKSKVHFVPHVKGRSPTFDEFADHFFRARYLELGQGHVKTV